MSRQTRNSTKAKSNGNNDKVTMKNLCVELNKKMEEMNLEKEYGNQKADLGNISNLEQEAGVKEDAFKNKSYHVTTATKKRRAEVALEKEGGIKRTAFGDITNTRKEEGAPAGSRKYVTEIENITQTLRNTKLRNCDNKKYRRHRSENNLNMNYSQLASIPVINCESSVSIIGDVFREAPRPRPTPPEGVRDFDEENMMEPMEHAQYAMETFQYFKEREKRFRVAHYMDHQTDITVHMRSFLVDSIDELQGYWKLGHETLYTAIKMIDLYLSKHQVSRNHLQLVGMTALMIACKIEETKPPVVAEFVEITGGEFDARQMLWMERRMITVLDYDLGFPLSYNYLRRLVRVCRIEKRTYALARYILELSLAEYWFNVQMNESQLAAAALILALKMKSIEGWASTIKYYSGLNLIKVNVTVQKLLKMMKRSPEMLPKGIIAKYSSKAQYEVAKIVVPSSVTLTVDG